MPKIEKSVVVNASAEKLFEALQQVEQFPQFLPHVKAVSVVENAPPDIVLDWVVVAPGVGMEVRWRARHTVNPDTHTVAVKPEGDALVQLRGEWRVEPNAHGSQLTATLDYEAKVPPMFAGIAQKAVDEIITGWLNGFKSRAEG